MKLRHRNGFLLMLISQLSLVKLPSNPLPDWVEPDWDSEPYGDDTTSEHEPFEADLVDAAGKPILMHSLTDVLINAEVLLSKDDSTALA